MKHFTLYDPDTGEVESSGYCPDEAFELQARAGLVLVEGSHEPAAVHFLNGVPYAKPPRPSAAHEWDVATRAWVADLVKAKVAKWEEIKRARDAVEYGGFTCNGLVYDSDAEARSRITGGFSLAMVAAAGTFSQEWTLADNSTVVLDAAGMIAVGVALGQHVAAAHAHAKQLRAAINAATTVEDLSAITWGTP